MVKCCFVKFLVKYVNKETSCLFSSMHFASFASLRQRLHVRKRINDPEKQTLRVPRKLRY